MNEDFYENEIRKNMNQIDTLNSTAEISNDGKELNALVDQMGEAINNTEKNIKDFSIYNMMNNNNDQTKTKPLERKLTDSKRRWKKLKEKLKDLKKNHNNNSINQEADEETSQSIRFNSFNKLQQATRSTIEMENMSGNILGDLNNQSSQMKNVSSKIGLINDDIDSSNATLNKMFSRQSRDKKIIIIFGVILILAFIGTLTYKIVTKFK